MAEAWDEARVQQYIDDGIEENLNLDYKAAGALRKSDGKRREITKDVSAMANSDGGIIIYGLTENGHLPGAVEPISRTEFTKEWLEHVIGNIRPKIDGLLIHPVPIGNSNTGVVFTVEIPKSHTAHQAMAKRYYKRFNFESVAMEDYEIRDVMNRLKHPRIQISLRVMGIENYKPSRCESYRLEVTFMNSGVVYANYVRARLTLPSIMLFRGMSDEEVRRQGAPSRDKFTEIWRDNKANLLETESVSGRRTHLNAPYQYEPLLPSLQMKTDPIPLANQLLQIPIIRPLDISWTTYADNSPPHSGSVMIKDIPIIYEDGRTALIRDWMN